MKRKYPRRKQQVTSAVRPGLDMRDVTDKAVRVFRWIDKNILLLATYVVIAVVVGLVVGYAVNYLRTYGSGGTPEQSNIIAVPGDTLATSAPTAQLAPTNTRFAEQIVPPAAPTDVAAGSGFDQLTPMPAIWPAGMPGLSPSDAVMPAAVIIQPPAEVPTQAVVPAIIEAPTITLTPYNPDPSIPWDDGELQRCQQYGVQQVVITTYGNGAGAGGCFVYLSDHWERIFP